MIAIVGWLFVAKDAQKNGLLLRIGYYTAFLASVMMVSF